MPATERTSAAVDRAPATPVGALAGFKRGLGLGLPIFLGYVPVGAAFGVLATGLGFTLFQALANSAFAIAGAGQFIGLSLLKQGSDVAGVLLATAVVNLRYVLFGSTISPNLRGISLPKQAWLAFTLTDETFAINIADLKERKATTASMAGVGAVAWLGWVTGTLLGVVGTSWIGDPSRWGVDFAMPAMFTALFVALAEDSRHVLTGLMAGGIALALPAASALGVEISSSWFIVIASIAGATIASVIWRD